MQIHRYMYTSWFYWLQLTWTGKTHRCYVIHYRAYITQILAITQLYVSEPIVLVYKFNAHTVIPYHTRARNWWAKERIRYSSVANSHLLMSSNKLLTIISYIYIINNELFLSSVQLLYNGLYLMLLLDHPPPRFR